jgi:hypothetical protein
MAASAELPSRRELFGLMAKLVAKIDQLEAQVRDLEAALQLDKTTSIQAAFDIPEPLAQVLAMLADGKPRRKEKLHAALYCRRMEDDVPDVKGMDSLIYQLRKRVEPRGIRITTIWGAGLQITAGLDVVRAAMEQPSVAA